VLEEISKQIEDDVPKFEAQKALFNVNTKGDMKYGDHLLPLLNNGDKEFDIIFVQG
jgi:hypothetical protein